MKTYPSVEKKLDDWRSAFDSISDKQNHEVQILKGMIIELEHTKKEEFAGVRN